MEGGRTEDRLPRMADRDPLYPDRVLRRDPRGGGRRARTTAGMLADAIRSRPGARRLVGALSALLMLGSVALFSYPFLTDVYARRQQGRLAEELREPETREAYVARRIEVGDAITRIRIPRIGVSTVVVEGTTATALRAGAGHYASTALPCEEGNVAIAGHRTTYAAPFGAIDELVVGDEIVVETPVGRCTYEVRAEPWITHPNDATVLRDVGRGSVLTLTTCNPPGSSTERLIVRARLLSSDVG